MCKLIFVFLKHFRALSIAIAALNIVLQPEDTNGQLDYRYDEFGFKVEEEGNCDFPSTFVKAGSEVGVGVPYMLKLICLSVFWLFTLLSKTFREL